mgnify:CR=1 FL=1
MTITNLTLLVLSFWFMEFVAWSNHKYIMHRLLWRWHQDHHRKDRQEYMPEKTGERRFEKNDRFFVIYALPAMVLMVAGILSGNDSLVFIGIGISLYGFTYFVVHDLMIHQRIPVPFLFKNHNFYTKAIIRAHTSHHRPKSQNDFHNYGLLIVPLRFFKT